MDTLSQSKAKSLDLNLPISISWQINKYTRYRGIHGFVFITIHEKGECRTVINLNDSAFI